jgi:transposase-like protein
MMPKGKRIWTLYKRHYVRELLERDVSRAIIAERLGVTLAQLRAAIRWHGLDKPEVGRG